MTYRQTPMTCRFYGVVEYDPNKVVKYGVRHYAHHRCYLAARRSITDLHDWQITNFPYRVIKEFGLDDIALAAALREKCRMEGNGARRGY